LVQAEPDDERKIYQLEGPAAYTPAQVAEAFSKALHTSVQVNEIPKEEWRQTLLQAGFSENAARCFCEMTAAVLDGKARPTGKGVTIRKGATTLQQYIDQKVRHLKGQPA
jgi:uncharacterized protein YbjT (DUF2867 family)